MLTLNDGRAELWQWDTGRTLAVDADCSQVHFSNKVFGRSIDVDVVDSSAIIPDVLLQTDKDLNVWAFVGTAENGYTKISKTFKVNRRNKPADYVFTPPEQTMLSELVGRLDRIEESQDPDAIKNAVEDYLAQNPVEVPVKSVNGQTGAVELTAEDVGAISQDDLQEATNEALAQAKATGEFDGEQGPKGDTGLRGEKGDTGPQGPKGDTGAAGATGPAGADGISPHIGSNGNWYTGDTDTGVSAQGPKGDTGDTGPAGPKGDTGDTGPQGSVGPQGPQGPAGKDGAGMDITGATVGQIAKISAVDENGKPTAWVPVDMPGGSLPEEFELVFEDEITEDLSSYKRDVDQDGKPFALSEAAVVILTMPFTDDTAASGRALGLSKDARWGRAVTNITDSLKKGNVATYDVVYVKVVNGYQMCIKRGTSVNSTNVFGNIHVATNSFFPVSFESNIENPFALRNVKYPVIDAVAIVGYTSKLIAAGTKIRLYKRKGDGQ